MEECVYTWRTLLAQLISETQEKQRIAQFLEVSPITLVRWASGTCNPRMDGLVRLLEALPQQRDELTALISEEFPSFATLARAEDEEPEIIPPEFYAQVISAYTNTAQSMYFWSLCKLILQQALEQLDPRCTGTAIQVVQCTPPREQNKILSLRGCLRQGTTSTYTPMEQVRFFLGAESLSGSVATSCHPYTIQNIHTEHRCALTTQCSHSNTVGVSVHPILRRGNIAGVLIVSSTQENYFTPTRLDLIRQYAELIALAFEPEEFYDPEQIDLRVMPPLHLQKPYFAQFQQRVANLLRETAHHCKPLTILKAREIVWHQLEDELLQLNYTYEALKSKQAV